MNDLSLKELIGVHNGLAPDAPLTSWKQGKPKLIARISALRDTAAAATTTKATAATKARGAKPKATGNKVERTIRAAAMELLCHVEYNEDRDVKPSDENRVGAKSKKARTVGLPYDEIIRRIQAEFPNCKTSVACLRWYSVKIRVEEEGYENLTLPQRRPRVKPRTA